MLIGACDPMLCPNWGFRYAGGGPRSPVNARATKNISISDLLPHIDIQQRRVRGRLPACAVW